MCGIIAMLSINMNILEYLLKGLYQLKNRGYDSAGFAIIDNDNFISHKYASENTCSIKKLSIICNENKYISNIKVYYWVNNCFFEFKNFKFKSYRR